MPNLQSKTDNSSTWMPVADLMSGMMVIFLFFSVLFIHTPIEEAQVYEERIENTQAVLKDVIGNHISDWNAEFIDSTLTIEFLSDNAILFEQGKATMTPYFKNILDNFFKDYVYKLSRAELLQWVEEIRIEGHTSSEGDYFKNIELSQQRANAVLYHILEQIDFPYDWKRWLKAKLTSNGMGSRVPKLKNGYEVLSKSRRVTFGLVLKQETAKKKQEKKTSSEQKQLSIQEQLTKSKKEGKRVFLFTYHSDKPITIKNYTSVTKGIRVDGNNTENNIKGYIYFYMVVNPSENISESPRVTIYMDDINETLIGEEI